MTAPHWIDGPAGAPVIVLAHSLGTSSALWELQVGPLAATHRVLRYDLRGHGAASVPPGPYSVEDLGRDVLDLLDALELERVSFCGISLGGAIAMWLGLHAPERLERLVLACASPRFGTAELWSERAATVRANGVVPLVDAALERWFAADFRARRPDVVAHFRELLLSTPAEGYAACCDALRDWDVRGQLAEIAVPTLVVDRKSVV